jgi:hypothetical protein
VVQVNIDGRVVTAGGLVLNPFSKTDLEGPIGRDRGRFTVVAEGDESVFGLDGGRENSELGLIEARFRRELPNQTLSRALPTPTYQYPHQRPDGGALPPHIIRASPPALPPRITSLRRTEPFFGVRGPDDDRGYVGEDVERAAGTGLTGQSEQEFEPISLGRLEDDETVLKLRLVIGTTAAIESGGHGVPPSHDAATCADPERPAARP